MDTKQRVIEIIARQVGLGCDETIETTQSLRNDLNLDSLDLCELWMDLEKEFGVIVPDEMVEGLTDVQSVIDAVESALMAFTNKK